MTTDHPCYSMRTLLRIATTQALGSIIDAIEPQGGESGSGWAWAVFGDGDRDWLHTNMQRELHDTIVAEYWAMDRDIAAFYGRQGLDPFGNAQEAQ